MIEPRSLNSNTLFLIGEVGKSARDKVIHAINLHGFNISPEQFTILVLLHYNNGINQSEIATTVKRDKTTVSRVIKRMLDSKLITKESPSDDKRANTISITKKGKKIQEKLISITGQIYRSALKGISEEDNILINKALVQILMNLDEM